MSQTSSYPSARNIALALIALIVVGLGAIKAQYGGGLAYPDFSTTPKLPASALESVVTLDYPPGNLAVSDDGRLFFNYHPFAKAERFGVPTVFELVDGKPKAYPDTAFQVKYRGVFGMTVDRQNRLWFVETAGLDHAHTRVLAFDLSTNTLKFEFEFAGKDAQFAQDLRVTPDGKTVILADTGLFKFTDPGVIVLDIASKSYRTVLTHDATTNPQNWFIRTAHGPHRIAFGLITFSVGVDGIEISRDGQWLYYGPMSGDAIYRVPVTALQDSALSDALLATKIERIGHKPLSDGIALDQQGRVLITDIENGGIARMNADGVLETLVKSDKVIWADGVVQAKDGDIVFTDSAIPAYFDQLARPPAAEKFKAAGPFHIYRFRAP